MGLPAFFQYSIVQRLYLLSGFFLMVQSTISSAVALSAETTTVFGQSVKCMPALTCVFVSILLGAYALNWFPSFSYSSIGACGLAVLLVVCICSTPIAFFAVSTRSTYRPFGAAHWTGFFSSVDRGRREATKGVYFVTNSLDVFWSTAIAYAASMIGLQAGGNRTVLVFIKLCMRHHFFALVRIPSVPITVDISNPKPAWTEMRSVLRDWTVSVYVSLKVIFRAGIILSCHCIASSLDAVLGKGRFLVRAIGLPVVCNMTFRQIAIDHPTNDLLRSCGGMVGMNDATRHTGRLEAPRTVITQLLQMLSTYRPSRSVQPLNSSLHLCINQL